MGMNELRRREAILLLPVIGMLIAGTSLYYMLSPGPENRVLFIGSILLGSLFYLVHLLLRQYAANADEVLLPATAMLTSLGLIFLYHIDPHLAFKQWLWTLIGLAGMVGILCLVQDYHWLAEYKYSFSLLGLVFLILTVLVGIESGGARNWLGYGSFTFQPAEVVKLLVIVFTAAYLSEYRESMSSNASQRKVFRLDFRGLGPIVLIGGLFLVLLAVQKDLGAALIFFALLLAMLYIALGRLSFVLLGLGVFGLASYFAYYLFPHVRVRVAIWQDPWPLADGAGYQLVQSFFSFGQGGFWGMGVGMSTPSYIPAVATDFIFAVAGGELGFLGTTLIIFLYYVISWRGFRLANLSPDGFGLLLAAGLALLFAIQTLVIVGGILKLLPLTGVTLPLMSYGGSSLVISYLMLGMLIKLSSLFSLKGEGQLNEN